MQAAELAPGLVRERGDSADEHEGIIEARSQSARISIITAGFQLPYRGSGANDRVLSPTVLRLGPYRLFFFSREEERMHVHVHSPDGEAKFWLEPKIELAQNHGLSPKSLRAAQKLIQARESTIRQAWKAHFDR